MALIFTAVDTGLKLHDPDDVTIYEYIRSGESIQRRNGKIEIIGGGGKLRTIDITEIDENVGINGDPPAGTLNGIIDQLDALLPFNSGSGGAGGTFSELTGTTYEGGNKFKEISGGSATSLTVDATSGGVLYINNTGAANTINLNGDSYSINASTDVDGWTGIGVSIVDGNYIYIIDKTIRAQEIPAPDVTAPVFQSATIEDADPSDLVIVYDENLDTGSVPAVGDYTIKRDTVPEAPASVGVASANVTHGLSSPALNGEVFTVSYTPGTNKIQDADGNEAVALVDEAVDNNVSGGGSFIFSDDFNAADTGDINGRVTPVGSKTWIGAGGIGIASNKAYTGSTSASPYVLDAGVRDIELQGTVSTVGSGCWPMVARSNSANFIQVNASDCSIYETVAGVQSPLAAGSGSSANGDVIRIVLVDDLIEVYRNATLVHSVACSDATTLPGTYVGFFFFNDTTSRVDEIAGL